MTDVIMGFVVGFAIGFQIYAIISEYRMQQILNKWHKEYEKRGFS